MREGNKRMDGSVISVPVKAGTVLQEATIAMLDGTGYAVPGAKAEGCVCCGVVTQFCDNSGGADGAAYATVDRGVYVMGSDGTVKETDLLKKCYVSGPQQVTLTATGASEAGRILGVEDGYVVVDFRA